jgi:hypothetical protein
MDRLQSRDAFILLRGRGWSGTASSASCRSWSSSTQYRPAQCCSKRGTSSDCQCPPLWFPITRKATRCPSRFPRHYRAPRSSYALRGPESLTIDSPFKGFQKRKNPGHYFTLGKVSLLSSLLAGMRLHLQKVFKVLWTEHLGNMNDGVTTLSETHRFNETFACKVRWFVVVVENHGHCLCL